MTSETISTRSGDLTFNLGVPTKETVARLYDEMDYQRACQLYLWAMPLVSFEQLRLVLEGTAGAFANDVAVFEGFSNLLVFFTPNATTPYTLGYLDLAKTGPVDMDVPAGPTAGAVLDFWQRPLTDLGVAGPDQGRGGKYVLSDRGRKFRRQREALFSGHPRLASSSFTVRSIPTQLRQRPCQGGCACILPPSVAIRPPRGF